MKKILIFVSVALLLALLGYVIYSAATDSFPLSSEMPPAEEITQDTLDNMEMGGDALPLDMSDSAYDATSEPDESVFETTAPDLSKINRESVLPYAAVEIKPTTQKCADETKDKKRRRCMANFIKNFLKSNLEYPDQAESNGIQGKVNVQFVVQEDGQIGEVFLLKSALPTEEEMEVTQQDLYKLLDTEAMRVINELPSMDPGSQGGKAVSVAYAIPVNFVLN